MKHTYPKLKDLTAELRRTNQDVDGPYEVILARTPVSGLWEGPDGWAVWDIDAAGDWGCVAITHVEHMPGDGKPFDAVAAARRLLAAAKDLDTGVGRV